MRIAFFLIISIGCWMFGDARQPETAPASPGGSASQPTKSPVSDTLDNAGFSELLSQYNVGDTIDLEGITVEVSGRPISLFFSYCFEKGIFRRACANITSLATPSSAAADTILVNNAEVFSEGDYIVIANGTEFQDNSGGQGLRIKEIRQDTIIMYNPFQFAMDSGAVVFHQFPLIRPILDSGEYISFEETLFDGNKACNSYTFDWRYNQTINLKAGSVLKNCVFMNTPTENIFMCGGRVENCSSYNLNGSFVHISCRSDATDTSYILNNYSLNTNQISRAVNGHNEGWLSYSANTRYVLAENNTAINGGNACFGNQGPDDFGNTFNNNSFKNFPARRFGIIPNHPAPDDLSHNNYFNVPDQ